MVSRLENILIVGDEKGPAVSFGSKTGIIEIKGRWVTENPIALNRVMLKWVKEYANSPQEKTELNIFLDYFSSVAGKCLLVLMEEFQKVDGVTVNWYHREDDDDMMECGKDFESILNLKFNIAVVTTLQLDNIPNGH
ncbi:MAG: DUF1987 domain-containing protein [Flavobacteriales bacterium]|nr:DUF1987 domain-containing protein [Flavobacteriales bacterium]